MTGTVPPNQSFTATIIHYVRQIIEKKLNIDSIKDEIETLRCENWSNYEIAHYYVAKSEPKNSTSGFTEKLSKYMPGAGKAVLKLIKIISESKQKLDLFGQYINSITGIALSYDPSISDVKVLYSPVAKVFVNAINPDEGGKISLTDRDSVKMLEHIKVYLPQIAKKIGVESFVDFASGIAESFPFIGGVVKQGVNQKIGQNGRVKNRRTTIAHTPCQNAVLLAYCRVAHGDTPH